MYEIALFIFLFQINQVLDGCINKGLEMPSQDILLSHVIAKKIVLPLQQLAFYQCIIGLTQGPEFKLNFNIYVVNISKDTEEGYLKRMREWRKENVKGADILVAYSEGSEFFNGIKIIHKEYPTEKYKVYDIPYKQNSWDGDGYKEFKEYLKIIALANVNIHVPRIKQTDQFYRNIRRMVINDNGYATKEDFVRLTTSKSLEDYNDRLLPGQFERFWQ